MRAGDMQAAGSISDGRNFTGRHRRLTLDRAASVVGILALGVTAIAWQLDASTELDEFDAMSVTALAMTAPGSGSASPSARDPAVDNARRAVSFGGYLGTTHTHPSTVVIKNPGRTDMTVRDFRWEGKPFSHPIYYGARIVAWPERSRVGAMLDFTHGKAIARFDDVATYTGTAEGKPLPQKATIREVFKHLEFSHGHNMLTLNGLLRLGSFRVQPYVGAGAGVSLPHTEIAFREENGRTYEYQYAGLVGQALVGVEVQLGRSTVFLEYKLSYAPYEVPLSGVVNGWLLVTDLWRQFKAWANREAPPQGRLATTLVTHHAIGGVLVRVNSAAAP